MTWNGPKVNEDGPQSVPASAQEALQAPFAYRDFLFAYLYSLIRISTALEPAFHYMPIFS